MYAPICLFTYNRLNETQKTLESLASNYLAAESELIVFSDGAKYPSEENKVEAVRDYVKSLSGFKSIRVVEAETNRGLANSIISGVTEVLDEYGKIIVLEDDLISAPNFLNFMNQALEYYENDQQIFSISGYTLGLPSLAEYSKDYYLIHRPSSWGWAIWKDRWEKVDWGMEDYPKFKYNIFKQVKFMRGGSDLPLMLWRQMNGRLDSWAIRWTYHQYKQDLYSLCTTKNKIINIGAGEDATHTKRIKKRYENSLEDVGKTSFHFDKSVKPDKKLLKEFRKKHSFYNRLVDKLRLFYFIGFIIMFI
ncbi:glycosyltransferase [Mangrovibacterium diazotrophicum]|uniref:Glycosyl transferase family 2 n=1 Tax=Mangrovibacterium diazotrophicum TaxID=1261403 RepID=A0A419VW64_9BACT|nr:glycosyltransferase [Mangrovibacterium diazotrophicum]RKD86351.1 glycosyl transferase family 2 [Mangrovibacterium diazotrophicum]